MSDKRMTNLETLAHNLDLWVEDAKQHNSEYVPVHRKTLATINDHLRELSRLQAAGGQGVERIDAEEVKRLADEYAEAEANAGGINGVEGGATHQHELNEDASYARQCLHAAIDRLAHPPAAPALVPLTDEQIVSALKACEKEDHTKEGWIWRTRIKWARAIERAHGINGLTVGGDGGVK